MPLANPARKNLEMEMGQVSSETKQVLGHQADVSLAVCKWDWWPCLNA